MTHPVEALSALLDGELPEAERREVEAHVASCSSCAQHLRELGAVDELARGLPPVGAPDGYMEALPGRVRGRIRARRPGTILRAPWVWPLAAGLALAVIAPLVLREGPSRDPWPEERSTAPAVLPPAGTPAPPVGPRSEPPPEPARDGARALEGDRERSERVERPPASRQDARRRLAQPPRAADAPAQPKLADSVPPAAPAPASAPETAARDEARANEAFAAPPPAEEEAKAGTPSRERGLAVGGAASTMRKSEGAAAAGEEPAYRSAAALSLSTPAEARRARDAWWRFVAEFPRGARADEARVRIVEASVAAFRAGGDEADRRAAERDGAAYLSRPDAPQAERVKAALRRLDPPR